MVFGCWIMWTGDVHIGGCAELSQEKKMIHWGMFSRE